MYRTLFCGGGLAAIVSPWLVCAEGHANGAGPGGYLSGLCADSTLFTACLGRGFIELRHFKVAVARVAF